MDVDWQHRLGPSVGAGLGHAKILAHNVSFAECLYACEAAGDACSAIDYVLRHLPKPKSTGSGPTAYAACPATPKQPTKRTCYAVHADAWHRPCTQPLTDNVASLKRKSAPQRDTDRVQRSDACFT